MRTHKGMKPQDVVVLLKVASLGQKPWQMRDLATDLGISLGELSHSIGRSVYAGLLSPDRKIVLKKALLDFLKHGLRYVFPQQPGRLVRGVPTAHSAEPLANVIVSNEPYVWAHENGTVRGQAVEPLYAGAVNACLHDKELYELLALTDAVRLGKVREQNIALDEIAKRIGYDR